MKRRNGLFPALFQNDLRPSKALLCGLVVLSLASCGGAPSGVGPSGSPNSLFPNGLPSPVASVTPVTTPVVTQPTVPVANPTASLPPPITAGFTLQGTRGTAPSNFYSTYALNQTTAIIPSISTDNRLVVTLIPNPSITIQNLDSKTPTGSMVQATCQQVVVKLIDATTNQPIGVGLTLSATQSPGGTGSCGSQPAVPSLEFSAASMSGHKLFNLEVSQVSSVVVSVPSWYAPNFYQGLNLNYFTWIQSGSLKIQTSSTQ